MKYILWEGDRQRQEKISQSTVRKLSVRKRKKKLKMKQILFEKFLLKSIAKFLET